MLGLEPIKVSSLTSSLVLTLLYAGLGLLTVTLASTLVLAYLISRIMWRLGRAGVDVHKPCNIFVVESVGVSILFSLLLATPMVYSLGFKMEALAFAFSVLIAGLIGLVDDFLVLRAWAKIALGALPSVPIILLSVYEPRPLIPLDGVARLTIVYPLSLPIVYTVATNAFNMYDTHNGVMLSSATLIIIAMITGGYIQYTYGFEESALAVILGMATLGAVVGMLYYNLYPARAFNGDVGSFTVGAAVASIAIIGRVEAVALIAGLPVALNGFLKITSIGFKERRGFQRPVEMEGWLIKPRISKDSPMSLTVLLTSRNPLSEPEVLVASTWLTWLSSILSLVTLYMTLARLS
jgi:UDP-N-acetylmuramyl pentapeptide phosphotransferase/UDP-N-acetylglucosamine-1-phosphate transferase